ncbi:MAG: hypothetical protein WA849_16625 [Candidatus Udaeobacter sp.]
MSAIALNRMKHWEVIADNLSKAGFSWGCVSAIDSSGRTIWITDAHRDDGQRFIVHADDKLTAFLELESAICAAERPEDCGVRETKPRQTVADHLRTFSITSSDSFTLSSARLNKPLGLDVR